MTTGQILLILAAGFSATLSSFQSIARQKGWPIGTLFHKNTIPALLGIGGILAVMVRVIVSFVSHDNGWSSFAYAILGAFVGVALITTMLGKNSGAIAVLAGPAACIGMFFFV